MADRDRDIGRFSVDLAATLGAARGNWESHWQELAERLHTVLAEFNTKNVWGGEKRTRQIYDARPAFALVRFASIMESLLTPHQSTWHRLRSPIQALNGNDRVARYFDGVNRILFSQRYSPTAMFTAASQENYLSIGAFGTGAIFCGESFRRGQFSFLYRPVPLSELFIRQNFHGQVDTVVRKMEKTARQLLQQFGDAVGDDVKRAADKEPDRRFCLLHVVVPAEDAPYMRNRQDEYASYYVIQDTSAVVSIGGYRTFPYIVSRYMTSPNEVYGRGPAMVILPEVRTLNEVRRTSLRTMQRNAEPPLLTIQDGSMTKLSTRPNAIIGGGLDSQGRQLVQPLQMGSNPEAALAQAQECNDIINEAFFINLFQILIETPRMTATEVIERAQEKSSLLSPIMGRQHAELLGPLIERELSLLEDNGLLPPMPPELEEAGGAFTIEYESPLTKMQKAEEVSAIMRTLEMTVPLAQIDPTVFDNYDIDQMSRIAARGFGVPESILRDPEDILALRQQRAEAQQAQSQAEMAEPMSAAMKNVAQAERLSRT